MTFFDLFAGIGGFRSGLEAVGGFRCVGYCEIDPYPRRAYEALYDTREEMFFPDARTIDPPSLPDLDLICGGFPCQSFSIAGRRGGFSDTRGTLFFEIARLAAEKRPHYLLLENVPGLLSHDTGRTFQTILNTLDELGYDVAWQVLNSKDFGVPQSRNRVYIVGYLRDGCAGEVLAFNQASPSALSEIGKHPEGSRVYDSNGLSCTLAANCGGFGGKTGMYAVPVIYDNLDEFNDSVCPPLHGYIRLNKKLVDRDGNMIAAIQAGIGGWDEGYVHLLWVDEPYRGQGLASYLLEECEREARENGADVLFVYARDWVADFYKKHGFTEYGAAEDFPKGHRSCRLKKLL